MSQLTTTEIFPGLWQAQAAGSSPHHPCNGYILRLEGGNILIDPPAGLDAEVVRKATGRAQVDAILLTHVQAEHAAGCANFPAVSIFVPHGDEYLCEGLAAYEARIGVWQAPWDWEGRGNYQGNLAGARNERPLALPGEQIRPIKGGEAAGLRVLRTPGHGKNAVTFLAEIEGVETAFCGDLVCGQGQLWNWYDADWDYGPETGQRALLASCGALMEKSPTLLCPAHGPVIRPGVPALKKLEASLKAVLRPEVPINKQINFPEKDSPASGFREISPSLHQWRTGNLSILVSPGGRALLVDAGPCIWTPVLERCREFLGIIASAKQALGIRQIDWVIPTHFHGDHTEMIPLLVETENARVIALESICGPMENPENYNLSCLLPWYDAAASVIKIDKKVPEGFVLEWEGFRLGFFLLGGQTKYHLGIEAVIDGNRTLFVGDAYSRPGGQPNPVLCWNDAVPDAGGWMTAMERMVAAEPDMVVAGHGMATKNPMPHLCHDLEAWQTQMRNFAALDFRSDSERFFSPFSGHPDGF